MPNVSVFDMAGKPAGEIALSDKLFGAEVNPSVLHSVVRAYLLNQRQGTQSTLTRSEVSGGGKKTWKQKGTGRARQGSTRAPQWTHGGIALGPKPRSYRVSVNKKVRRLALAGALSSKVAEGDLIVVDGLCAEEFKTSVMDKLLKALGADKKTTVVLADADEKTVKSFANIPYATTIQANSLNAYQVLDNKKLVVAKAAIEKIEEVYGK